MARRRHMGKDRHPLFEKGLLAILVGCGFLTLPFLIDGPDMLRPALQGLKIPGWIALGLGISLLAVHYLVKRAKVVASAPARVERVQDHPGSREVVPPAAAPAPPEPRSRPGAPAEPPLPAPPFAAPAPQQTQWTRQVLDDIEWRRFEALCERLFAQGGFEARTQSHGADGGVDIWLYSRNSEGPAAVVQCKHWVGKPVGVKELREFFGVMASKGLKRGTFATSSKFTPAAMEFAKDNGINLLDGERLLALIGRRSQAQQDELLAVAYEGEYWRPTCASCGVKMTGRTAAKGGSRFWGCTNYPKCRTTMPARGV